MAVTIVETVGSANSNSYVSLAEANTYFESRMGSDLWTAANTDKRSMALITAANDIDRLLIPNGTIASDTQALSFPRVGLVDPKGRNVLPTVIPIEIKKAQYEQAYYLLSTGGSVNNPSALGKGILRAQVSSLHVTFDKSFVPNSISKVVQTILDFWGSFKPGTFGNNVSSTQVERK